jgi:hypothetical protein
MWFERVSSITLVTRVEVILLTLGLPASQFNTDSNTATPDKPKAIRLSIVEFKEIAEKVLCLTGFHVIYNRYSTAPTFGNLFDRTEELELNKRE